MLVTRNCTYIVIDILCENIPNSDAWAKKFASSSKPYLVRLGATWFNRALIS